MSEINLNMNSTTECQEDESKCYGVEPESRKSAIQIESYTKLIPEKGYATFKITTYFRTCYFTARLTKDEVRKIKESGTFSNLSYDSEFDYACNSWDIDYEMVNNEIFTDSELSEIENKIHNVFKEHDDDEDDEYDIYDKLEEDGWDIDDTEYIIENGVILTEM